jgi:uncharacterized protein (TIGR03083 family)
MPTTLALGEHLAGLRAAVAAFVVHAKRAGLDADVPTCPGWTVRRLVAHQAMAHRWASALLRGERVDPDEVDRVGGSHPDPLAWLATGAEDLLAAIEAAAEDVPTVVFLNDAPPPRRFWARRQCHETTMHAVDALSAALGRYPRGHETWIEPTLARDGIDELLGGFVTRNHSRVRCAEPLRVLVQPEDAVESWLVEVSRRPALTTRGTSLAGDDADVVLRGSSVALYLALWNRSDEVSVAPDEFGLPRWSSAVSETS